MKTLIAILLTVFLISSANAQFDNFKKGAFIGYGAEFLSAKDYNLLQTQVTFDLQFQTGIFLYGSQTTTMISDSVSTPFTGLKIGVSAWNNQDNNQQLFITGHGLIGEAGDKLLGGGVMFQTPQFGINIDISQRYKRKSLNIMLCAGAYF